MRYLHDILYIEFAELAKWGVPTRTLESWSEPLKIVDPDCRSKRLIHYELLHDKYKKLIEYRLGCSPYAYQAKTVLKSYLKPDYEAEKFYQDYEYNEDMRLPPDHIKKYSEAVSWLNMIDYMLSNKKMFKKKLNLDVVQIWENITDIITAEDIELPRTPVHLKKKIEELKGKKGYECLIDWRFGNDLAKKVNDETSEAVLFELIAHPHQFDDVTIAEQYNAWAAMHGCEVITAATAGNYRRRNGYTLDASRYGNGTWYNKYGLSIPQSRPSGPLLQINSDDNNLDVYFLNPDTGNQFNRIVLIVVKDSYNDMPLGYSWRFASAPTKEMVYAAYLDAAYYVKAKLGDWYMWQEIKADKWSISALKPWYESQAIFTGTAHKNARGKYIEQSFSHHWTKLLKKRPGYTGHNISAPTRGVNQEALYAAKDSYYLTTEAEQVIEDFMNELRHLPGKYNQETTREQEWIDAFNEMDAKLKRQVNDEWILHKLGKQTEKSVTITNKGVIVQISGIKYNYRIPERLHQQWIGAHVNVVYDGIDMNRVLLMNDKGFRCVAHTFEKSPSAALDHHEGSRIYLNSLINEKRRAARNIAEKANERKDILKREKINVEAMLMAGPVLPKEQLKAAEAAYMLPSGEEKEDDFNPRDLY